MNIHLHTHAIEPEDIMAYLDGELPVEDAARIAAHLSQCPDCQIIADDLKQVSLSTLSWKVELHSTQLPAALDEALYQRSFEPTSTPTQRSLFSRLKSRRLWLWAGIPTGAFAAVLLLFFVYVITRPPAHTYSSQRLESIAPPERVPPVPQAPSPRAVQPYIPPQQTDLPTEQPLIARTANLTLTASDLDRSRQRIDAILHQHHGHLGNLNVTSTIGEPRSLTATLRVPATELDSTITDLMTLGHVDAQSQNDEEVTAQYVDLEARLRNARNTETRLTDLLNNRTGKLSDVLQVETQISRVRGQIEQMESQKKLLETRVALSSIRLTVNEQFKAQAQIVPDSTATRLRNAAIDGYRSAVNGLLSVLIFLISAVPTILIWVAILFFPARYLWKKRPWRQTQ